MTCSTRTLQPHRALVHPLFWGGLAVLLLNDHVWKHGETLPPMLTGKLSDFAGLLVAPAVLAVALQSRSRGALQACHLAVVAGFSAINLSEHAADLLVQTMAFAQIHWKVWRDPTDLIALPAAWLGYRVFRDAAERPQTIRALWSRALQRGGLIAGAIGCLATSRTPPPRVAADAAHVYAPDRDEERGVVFLDISSGRPVRQGDAVLSRLPRPAVVGHTLVGWSPDGEPGPQIIGIDTQTGKSRFKAPSGETYGHLPLSVAGNHIITLEVDYGWERSVVLASYSAKTGGKAWSQELDDDVEFELHASGNLLVLAEEALVRRLDPATGVPRWTMELPDDVVALTSLADRVYARLDDGTVVILRARTGNVMLSRPFDSFGYRSWTTPLSGSLTASSKSLFLATDEGIMVLDSDLRSRATIAELGRPYAEGDVVIATFDTYIYRLDPLDGHIVWRYRSDLADFWSDFPTLTPNTVVLAGDDTIIAVDAASGRERWRYIHP